MREFVELISDAQLYDSGDLNIRDAKLCFVRAPMRACHESSSARAYDRLGACTLTFLEFLEAHGRAADTMQEPWQQQRSVALRLPDRPEALVSKPLDIHLKTLIYLLKDSCRLNFRRSMPQCLHSA
jgi:hypothetical protein